MSDENQNQTPDVAPDVEEVADAGYFYEGPKRRVTLAYPYKHPDGRNLKADATHSLPLEEADRLLHAGLAREPEKKD